MLSRWPLMGSFNPSAGCFMPLAGWRLGCLPFAGRYRDCWRVWGPHDGAVHLAYSGVHRFLA
jgi:hypothetical protein